MPMNTTTYITYVTHAEYNTTIEHVQLQLTKMVSNVSVKGGGINVWNDDTFIHVDEFVR